jgi:hypothetical protein
MRGWIQYIEGEVAANRLGYVSDYDTDLEISAEHNCAGNQFCNPNILTGSVIYDDIVITDTSLFVWDSS